MKNTCIDIDAIIVGGGPAGLAAALKLRESGVQNLLILEREKQLGGILRQCIHDGFGLTRFGTSLSGPEYAEKFIQRVQEEKIPYLTNASVIDISPEKQVTVATRDGILRYRAKAVILCMGCRERTRGALAIPGERPAGVYTAGVAQAYMNLYDRMPAREVVILGSGDIGLIMARRLTLEGAHVKAVYEIQSYPSGLPRNIEQCLNDYQIPLHLGHTVTGIHGKERLEGVTISQVDERMRPVPGTEEYVSCDTLILSVGLIPENELSQNAGVTLHPRTRGADVDEFYQTDIPGVFSAGNVLHVHDLVDFVSLEAEALGNSTAEYLREGKLPECSIQIRCDASVNHTIPCRVSGERDFTLSLRVSRPMKRSVLTLRQGDREILTKKLPKALPAEMIQILVPASQLNGSEELLVSISERKEGGRS